MLYEVITDVLLNRVTDLGADLMVMGGYGRSRLRELVLGGVTALEDASIVVEPGEVVGLIGPNGAGKTRITSYNVCYTKLLRAGTLSCSVSTPMERGVPRMESGTRLPSDQAHVRDASCPT